MISPAPPQNQTGKNEVFSWEKQARPVPQAGHSGATAGDSSWPASAPPWAWPTVWAFPYRAAKYGGGAFLVAYFTIALFLGLIGVSGEIAFGRWGRTGPFGHLPQGPDPGIICR